MLKMYFIWIIYCHSLAGCLIGHHNRDMFTIPMIWLQGWASKANDYSAACVVGLAYQLDRCFLLNWGCQMVSNLLQGCHMIKLFACWCKMHDFVPITNICTL